MPTPRSASLVLPLSIYLLLGGLGLASAESTVEPTLDTAVLVDAEAVAELDLIAVVEFDTDGLVRALEQNLEGALYQAVHVGLSDLVDGRLGAETQHFARSRPESPGARPEALPASIAPQGQAPRSLALPVAGSPDRPRRR